MKTADPARFAMWAKYYTDPHHENDNDDWILDAVSAFDTLAHGDDGLQTVATNEWCVVYLINRR